MRTGTLWQGHSDGDSLQLVVKQTIAIALKSSKGEIGVLMGRPTTTSHQITFIEL